MKIQLFTSIMYWHLSSIAWISPISCTSINKKIKDFFFFYLTISKQIIKYLIKDKLLIKTFLKSISSPKQNSLFSILRIAI
jgi:hypothetical protein